ncbi:MAG: FHA domain-containing protein [Coriobacteriaceae bacterium]|nr:FHA domain-containing protein [Coriobacteriaceae bacterium]MDD7111392.1 FHA domain-containing protein [Coriobacteriaceae bacterium]MDY5810161.1 FHA domain-containing protein [Coriobacteriales bacterium]
MNENMNNLTGTMGQTQSFNLMPDITLPNIDMSSQDSGLAELTIVRGPSTGERFILDIPEVTIGRDPNCEVFLNDRTVSRRHAHLSIQGGRAIIEDLGSLNGTWVDAAIVSSSELFNGSTIQIGTFKMIFNMH